VGEHVYRVVQWGTGCTGQAAVRAILRHPALSLVGVKVYADAKVGRDAADICGLDTRTGVAATQDIGAILALKPDCVSYMPDAESVDDMCRLLAGGANIVTPILGYNHRDSIDPVVRRRLEAACAEGGSSLYASGSSPGWLSEILPFALTVTQSRLDRIVITDFSDMSASSFSAMMLFDKIHFGALPADVDPSEPMGIAVSTPPTLRMMAEALGLRIDEIVSRRDFALATRPVTLAAGTVEAGTIGAVRMELSGLRDGQPVVTRRTIWHVTRDIDADWDLRPDGIHYRVDGDVPLDVMIGMPIPADQIAQVQGAITANPVVNAIPYACRAPAGIRHTSELPTVLARFS
jgi:4-hydroxy-tetrahydrodipicolinate reductase